MPLSLTYAFSMTHLRKKKAHSLHLSLGAFCGTQNSILFHHSLGAFCEAKQPLPPQKI
jgi:hypothetical protein